ncbi:MAG: GNAT family N-acetyltransferase [Woeseiaceae bacterium]|nr:GNAT family N-acetyltransferase [Woeseiaceae bacterium]
MGMLTRDGWTLREAGSSDIEALMQWFPTHDDINVWGGPSFRYPFTCETFFEDVYWEKMASFCLSSPCGDLVAFGQLYDRDNRIHLARLVVAPGMRGQGLGRRLIEMLMEQGKKLYPRDEYSLFVFRDNIPAYECYRALGFRVSEYPKDMPHADVCYYLTRPEFLEEERNAS